MTFTKKRASGSNLERLIKEKGLDFDMEALRAEFGSEEDQGLVILDSTRRIHPVCYKSKYPNAMLKIPLKGPKEIREMQCKAAYDIFKETKDHSNMMRLIGDKPWKFGEEHYGVLMELGEGSLLQYIQSESPNKKEIFNIIVQAARGIHKIHYLNKKHRDIKPSNIIYLKDKDEWCIADFATATKKENTSSKKNDPVFWSPEFYASLNRNEGLPYTISEDIYQLGVTLYIALTNNLQGFDPFWIEIKKKKQGDGIKDAIKSLEANSNIKYFLKKLTAHRIPEKGVPKGNSIEDYRYQSLVDFIEEAETGKKIVISVPEKPKTNPEYEKYKTARKSFENNLSEAESISNPKEGITNYKVIEKLVNSYENVLQAKDERILVRLMKIEEELEPLINRYESLRDVEEEIINKFLSKIKEVENENPKLREEGLNILEKAYERIFMWGPPFTSANREWPDGKKMEGKARYTSKETISQKTHYHPKIKKYRN